LTFCEIVQQAQISADENADAGADVDAAEYYDSTEVDEGGNRLYRQSGIAGGKPCDDQLTRVRDLFPW
jgi:hypothetical protein